MPTPPFLRNPSARRWTALAEPPWRNDSHVANAWQSYPMYMSFAGASPYVASWGPQLGTTSFVASAGSVTLTNPGFGQFSSLDTGVFDGDAVAASFSGASTPFSFACLIGTTGAQAVNRHGFAITHTANLTECALGLVYLGTNADFQLFRRNSANTRTLSSVFSCASATWCAVEAYFDGTNLTTYQNGVLLDNAIAWNPGGTIGVDAFCLAAYHGNTGRVLASTARYHAIVCTGGSVWPLVTQSRVRAYLNRLRLVV